MFGPQKLQLRCHLLVRKFGRPLPGNDHQIDRWWKSNVRETEKLAQQSLDPVTRNGPTNLPADSQPKPGGAARPLHNDDQKMGGMTLAPPLPDKIELIAAVQPAGRRKVIPLPNRH